LVKKKFFFSRLPLSDSKIRTCGGPAASLRGPDQGPYLGLGSRTPASKPHRSRTSNRILRSGSGARARGAGPGSGSLGLAAIHCRSGSEIRIGIINQDPVYGSRVKTRIQTSTIRMRMRINNSVFSLFTPSKKISFQKNATHPPPSQRQKKEKTNPALFFQKYHPSPTFFLVKGPTGITQRKSTPKVIFWGVPLVQLQVPALSQTK